MISKTDFEKIDFYWFHHIMKEYELIPHDSLLFRASDTIEERPTPRLCPDTGKTGVYFSAYYSHLAECRCIEERRDMYLSMYKTTKTLRIQVGKYAFTNNYTGRYSQPFWTVPSEDNTSHYDSEIHSTDPNVIDFGHPTERDERHAELFLVEKDLENVVYVASVRITFGECVRIWYRQSWFEEMANRYILHSDSRGIPDVHNIENESFQPISYNLRERLHNEHE